MADATIAQEGPFQKTARMSNASELSAKDATEKTPARNAGISADDTKEIEAQIAELALKNRIILQDDMGKPLKKEMAFPIAVNLALFCVASVVLFFLAHYFNRQESGIGRSSAFSSVEGELINQLREDSENIISGKEQEIAVVREELNALERQRQRELANFDAQLEAREATFLEQARRDREAEQARLATQGLSQAEINERLRNFERDRMEQYQRQLAEERNVILKDFEQRESQYHDSIRALNDERRIVQTEIQRQREISLQMEEANVSVQQELEQAQADMRRMREAQQRTANEETLIVELFNKIQGDFQSRQFETAITDANNLTQVLRDMPGTMARRTTDMALAVSLARRARLELERQEIQNAGAASAAGEVLAAEQQANLRIAELQEALNEANRQAAEREAALQRTAAEREQMESLYARNLANAVGSIRQAKRFADGNDAAGAMNAYRQAAGYFGLSDAETAVFISGVETLSRNSLIDAVAKQKLESDKLSNQTESAMRDRIAMLDAALANLRKSDADKQGRISRLEAENEQLRQQNQQLAGAVGATANQNAATASQMQARISQLDAALANLRKSDVDKQARISRLETENEQLRQQNQQLAGAAGVTANQNAATASQMQARISQLETEIAQLRQQNQQLAGAATNQNAANAAAASQMQERISRLEAESNRLKESERTLTYNLSSMTDNYNSIKPNSDAYLSLTRAYSVYKKDPNRLSNLEHFLNEREVSTAFPGFVDKARIIADDLTLSARKEALNTVSSIMETALRIQTLATRKLYLEGMKVRYMNDPAITGCIEMLIKRL
ncbi:MAG: hypothetical protein LBB48_06830 [Treponema sp.]|nr:hypothetical protein [Treponema sp.]